VKDDYRHLAEIGTSLQRGNHMNAAAPYLITLGRVVLSLIFIQSGIMKIFDYAGTQTVLEAHSLPVRFCRWSSSLRRAAASACCSGFLPAGRRWPWRASACSPRSTSTIEPGDMMQMINFAKNITIAGGFLVLAGRVPGRWALDNRRS